MNPELVFMQDNAPGHRAAETRTELREREVPTIFWPAFSPDLNPIEHVWNLMKDWIYKNYPGKLSYDQLRVAVKGVWEAISSEELADLVGKMRDHYQAVIDAEGGHIPY
jgi:transposase